MNPDFRRAGIGKALFAELAKVAEEKVRALLSLRFGTLVSELSYPRIVLASIGPF